MHWPLRLHLCPSFSNEFSTLIPMLILTLFITITEVNDVRYMVTLSALRLDDDDSATDAVATIFPILAVLQCEIKDRRIHWHKTILPKLLLIVKYLDGLMIVSVEMFF